MDDSVYTNLITKTNCKIKVSSILDNNSKQFGGHFLYDCSDDTCWSSGQGNSQSIIFEFVKKPIYISYIEISIQTGFSPKEIEVFYYLDNKQMTLLTNYKVEDVNDCQVIKINKEFMEGIQGIKLFMNTFKDFFGRVTFYTVKVYGK